MRTVVFGERDYQKLAGSPNPASKRKKKKAGTGATAMKHARAALEEMALGMPTMEAQKKVVWIPDHRGPCKSCGRNLTPRSMKEDLFGCFDLFLMGFPDLLIQVTTQTARGESVAARKRKIRENFVDVYGPKMIAPLPMLEIWSWV
ncbi:MAG: hypothetical protein V3W32_05785, partial [Gemmatimonadota bacterium]